jgi:cytochrome P450
VQATIAVYPREVYEELLIVRRYRGRPYLLVSDPEGVRQVLLTNAANYMKPAKQRRLIEPTMGRSLLTSEADEWQQQRRLTAPAFRPNHIAAGVPGICAAAEKMMAGWRAPQVDVAAAMVRLAFEVIGRSMFGIDPGTMLDPIPRAGVRCRVGLMVIESLIGMGLLGEERGQRIGRWLGRVTGGPIRRAVRSMIEAAAAGGVAGDSLLAAFEEGQRRESGRSLSAQEIQDHLVTMLIAGHATTAAALAWVWYLLDLHPEVREALEAELAGKLAGRPPAAEDIAGLRYTRMVVDETLRLYPVVPVVGRVALAEDRVCGVPVPAGAHVSISPWVIHRHRRLWPEPALFDPGRFAPERLPEIHRFAYIPFSAGPRVCIGQGFALTEMVAIVATVAQRFRLRLRPGRRVEIAGAGHVRPRHGLPMTVERRA